MKNPMDDVNIDETKAKDLWYALLGLCYSIDMQGLRDQVNNIVDDSNQEMGAYTFARSMMNEAFIGPDSPNEEGEE